MRHHGAGQFLDVDSLGSGSLDRPQRPEDLNIDLNNTQYLLWI